MSEGGQPIYCHRCGVANDRADQVCFSCGAQLYGPIQSQRVAAPDQEKTEGFTAALLSFLICGLGQIYNGRIWKGLGHMALAIMTGIAAGFIMAGLVDRIGHGDIRYIVVLLLIVSVGGLANYTVSIIDAAHGR